MKKLAAAAAAVGLAIAMAAVVVTPAQADTNWNNMVAALTDPTSFGYAPGDVVSTSSLSDSTITIAKSTDIQYNYAHVGFTSVFAAPMINVPAGMTLSLGGSGTGTFSAAGGQCSSPARAT